MYVANSSRLAPAASLKKPTIVGGVQGVQGAVSGFRFHSQVQLNRNANLFILTFSETRGGESTSSCVGCAAASLLIRGGRGSRLLLLLVGWVSPASLLTCSPPSPSSLLGRSLFLSLASWSTSFFCFPEIFRSLSSEYGIFLVAFISKVRSVFAHQHKKEKG